MDGVTHPPPARYDAVAQFYRDGWTDALDDPVTSALLDVVGDVAHLDVLDLACGHGRVTRELARRGGRVVGLDVSGELLAIAQAAEADEPLGVTYLHDDAATCAVLDDDSFDVVVCSFALSDIDDLDGALTTVTRVLRPSGRFAFSMLHPCFAGGGDVSGAWPSRSTYYDEQHWYADDAASSLRRQVGANHRMLSTYLNALTRHGLSLTELVEPRPDAAWSAAHPEASAGPVYLVAGAHKQPMVA